MSAHPLTCLEEFQVKLDRARSLSRHMQTLALEASGHDAVDTLDMIDAIAEALTHRMTAMMEDAEAAHRRLSEAMKHFGSLSDALAEVEDGGNG